MDTSKPRTPPNVPVVSAIGSPCSLAAQATVPSLYTRTWDGSVAEASARLSAASPPPPRGNTARQAG